MSGSEPVLEVDLDAGFRVVARYQLAGKWQIPAELVRMAVAHGAREVETQFRARRVVVVATGAMIPSVAIEGLASILNGGADGVRLRALTLLEDRDAMALGWAVGSSPRRLVIEQRSPGNGISFVRDGEDQARVSRLPPTPETVLRVTLERPSFNIKQAAAWLRTASRFAAVPVRLDGEDLRKELRSGCFRARLVQPMPATVALGVSLEAPRLWLLRHGILEARVSVPGWPAFEGAVELADTVDGWVSPPTSGVLSLHICRTSFRASSG